MSASALAYNTGRRYTADQIRQIQRVVGADTDGLWDPATVTAVHAWQAAHGLTADGQVGPRTLAAITAHDPPRPRRYAWTVLVFAGPGAFTGLTTSGDYVDDAAGLAAIHASLQPGEEVAIVVQQIAEPGLLELLTNTWRARRSTCDATGMHTAADEPRDLAAFLRSARAAAPADNYALVLLGDVLRATETHFEEVWNFPDERLGRPITVSTSPTETRDKRPITVSTSPTETRDKRPITVATSPTETRDKRPITVSTGPTETRDKRPITVATDLRPVARWVLTADDLAQPKPPWRGTWKPEPAARVLRRIDLLASALATSSQPVALLITDTCDLGDLELAGRVAPFAELLVTTQIEAPRSAGPLVDLLAALAGTPRATPEALARKLVAGHDAVLQTLALRCRALVERAEPDQSDPRLDCAQRLLHAGWSATAVRCAGLPGLSQRLRDLAVELAALTVDEATRGDDQGVRGLHRCVAAANERYDSRLQRCDLIDLVNAMQDPASELPPRWRERLRPHVRAIREHVQTGGLVLATRQQRPRGDLHGVSLTMPLDDASQTSLFARPELHDGDPWAAVFQAMHDVAPLVLARDEHQRAQARTEQRMYEDLAAFYRADAPPSPAPVRAADTRAWTMLHYLAADIGDATRGASLDAKEAARRRLDATLARDDLRHVHLAYDIDLRPPIPSTLYLYVSSDEIRMGNAPDLREGEWDSFRRDGDDFTLKDGDRSLRITRAGDIYGTSGPTTGLRESLRLRLRDASLTVTDVDAAGGVLRVECSSAGLAGGRAIRGGAPARGPVNSGDPGVLGDFVRWGLHDAPSRHAGLVISDIETWDANFELCQDRSSRAAMSVSQLARSLERALRESERDAFDVLILETERLSFLEVAYELRSVTRVLILLDARGVQAGDYGHYGTYGYDALFDLLEQAFDADGGRLEARALADVVGASAGLDRGYAELESAWRTAVARRVATAVVDRNPRTDQLLALDLTRIDALARHFDGLCRLLFAGLAREPIWKLVSDALLHWSAAPVDEWYTVSIRDLDEVLARLRVGVDEARTAPEIAAFAETLTRVDRSLAELRVAGGGRLKIYCPASATDSRRGSYAALDFNRKAHLHALLGALRIVDDASHRLWDLVLTGLAHSTAAQRRELLARLTGEADTEIMLRPLAALATPPLITLSLESDESADGERYLLRLGSSESSALLLQQESHVDPERIDRALGGLEYLLARGDATASTWSYLEALGATLGEDIISRLHDRLEAERNKLTTGGVHDEAHLALQIPRELMRYPWELMSVPVDLQSSSAKQMLCERFAIGRQIWSEGGRAGISRQHSPLKVLLIGDPRLHGGGAQLPGARDEVRAIADTFAELTVELAAEMDFDRDRDVFIHRTVTAESLRQLLRQGEYDIIHFSGHARFDPDRGDRSAWLLSDGPLWASELRATLAWCPRPPWLIYANACEAGMSGAASPRYRGEVFGLADACIREGVSSYIAPLWPIGDDAACTMATALYRCLLLERATLGAALLDARRRTRARCEAQRGRGGSADISWASVVLYGDPTDRLFDALRK